MHSAPTGRAVANLHLHLEYDSGLEVIAAAMATVPDGGEDTVAQRAHVSHDISTSVAHLLDVDALIPDGGPLRIVEASVDVVVDVDEDVIGDDDGEAPADDAANIAARDLFEAIGLTEDELSVIAEAPIVAETVGPPPFDPDLAPAEIPRAIADWGLVAGSSRDRVRLRHRHPLRRSGGRLTGMAARERGGARRIPARGLAPGAVGRQVHPGFCATVHPHHGCGHDTDRVRLG